MSLHKFITWPNILVYLKLGLTQDSFVFNKKVSTLAFFISGHLFLDFEWDKNASFYYYFNSFNFINSLKLII